MTMDLPQSYWERQAILQRQDFIIVGAGLSGLTAALYLRSALPDAKIRIVEQHIRSRTASTRNAGFACFGCLTEFLSDYDRYGDSAVDLFAARYSGIKRMLDLASGHDVGYQCSGGYEPLDKTHWTMDAIETAVDKANRLLRPRLGITPYEVEDDDTHMARFSNHHLVRMAYEGQLDPFRLIAALTADAMAAQVDIIYGTQVKDWTDNSDHVRLNTSAGTMTAGHVILATNASIAAHAELAHLHPARNSVLVTEPIHLGLRGIYHLEDGYIYFRSTPDGRLLIGGGRHWNKSDGYTTSTAPDVDTIARLQHYAAELLGVPSGSLAPAMTWAGTICTNDSGSYTISSIEPRVTFIGGYNGIGVSLAAEATYHGVQHILQT